jgi:hypothetical protein
VSDHEAKEAARLLADDALKAVFDRVRQEALEALATATDDILRLQALVAAVDAIRAELKAMTYRTEPAEEKASPFA